MSEFDRVWESSSHNDWSFAYPTVVFIGLVTLAGMCFIKKPAIRRILKVGTVVVFSVLAIRASELEITEKWRLRAQLHDNPSLTEEEKIAIFADGANRIAGPIAGGGGAFVIFTGLLLSARFIRRYREVRPTHLH